MPDPKSRKARQDRHASEVEDSQRALRESIDATQRLLDASDAMLKRHRRECDDEEADPEPSEG
ncbi:MAG TPA: hypothetical protein VGB79_00855 [Allosphingosinicella sp.]|jgi:hypothetical protein